ncbi:hypothetical protein [Ornithinimicrobium cavernae]|uniref:hypothetical protein n=1 Tax=Ornithinimicrobium cavernae TaxID=2666047 RepID=UPI000D6878B3|nr:hypothetical protein [Ornithinimicrobium cavernae]
MDLRIRQDALAGDLLGSHLAQFGGVDIEVSIATLEGGHIRLAEGRSDDLSLRMPEFVPDGPYPRAVVAITTTDTSPDALAPGDADFRFGIDFWVDPVSADRKLDNGDNMLQRGLASDPSQFKLELDRGRPNCRIAGSAGAVEVRAQEKVVPERWYRAECSRRGDDVVLTVTEFHQGSDPGQSVTTGHGATGTVAWTRPEIPLALGGKLAANGAVIRSATDQFNGRLANPELIIDLA